MSSVGRRKIYLSFAVALPIAAAYLGFHTERQRLEMGGDSPPPFRTTLKRVFVRPPDSIARLNELRSLAGKMKLSPQDTAEAWQIIRGFNLEQLKSYLEELPLNAELRPANDTLLGMLFSRWANIDPAGAAEEVLSLAGKPDRKTGTTPLQAVITAWMASDPEAALSWATTERPGSRQISNLAFRVAAQLFVQQDPGTAFERIKQATSQNPLAANDVLNALAQRAAGSEENRRQYFDLTKDPRKESPVVAGAFRRATTELARNWAENDPIAALNGAGAYGLPPNDLEDFLKTIVMSVAKSNPAAVFQWIQNQPEGTVEANTRSDAYFNAYWRATVSDPAQAIDWAVQHDQFDLLSDILKRRAPEALGYQDGGPESQKRVDAFRIQFQAWQEHQPQAAAEWLGQLPTSFRDTLTSPANASH